MKAILIFLILLIFAFADDEKYGCEIPKGKNHCCWLNPNGCCEPPKPDEWCTSALTDCCKMKRVNQETGEITYYYFRKKN